MEWLSANWIWVVVAVAFVAMHLFGHGGHGGHGPSGAEDRDARKDRQQDAPRGGHRH